VWLCVSSRPEINSAEISGPIMRVQLTPKLAVLKWAVAICTPMSASAQPPSITLVATAETREILQGEPLIISVTLKNFTMVDVFIRWDAIAFDRVTTGPIDFPIISTPPQTNPDSGFGVAAISPRTEKSIRFVARETALIQNAGEYQMKVRYAPLQLATDLKFTVKPHDSSALRARAYELLGDAADPRAQNHSLALEVLEAINPTIAKPLLCDLLGRNPLAHSVPLRLEELGDTESIDCLVDALPAAQGLQKQVIAGALERLSRNTQDGELRQKLLRALERSP
jgi:hypothetical protein